MVLEVRQFLRHRRRDEVRACGRHLAHLHEHAAALLQGVAEPAGERDLPGFAVLGVTAEAEGRTEPVADRDAADLRVSAHPPTAALHGIDRVRDRREPGLGAGERARLREQLDPDGRRHDPEGREQPHVAREPFGHVLALARDRERQRDAAGPADHTRQQRGRPRAANAEQPADDPGEDEHARQRQQDGEIDEVAQLLGGEDHRASDVRIRTSPGEAEIRTCGSAELFDGELVFRVTGA